MVLLLMMENRNSLIVDAPRLSESGQRCRRIRHHASAARISDRGDQDRWLIATHFAAAGDHRQHRGPGRHDPHLCCSWAIYFSAAVSSENNFSLEPPGRL